MLKHFFDFTVSLITFVLLSPLLFLIALLIKLDSPGPAIYKGLRAGKNGQPFKIYKFRTLVQNADRIGGPSTSDDDPRLTKIGRLLRHYKLDELPQLFNVLKREMSFVGPRPEVVSEVQIDPNKYRKILSVTPGITDYASLRFPNEGEILKGAADPHEAYRQKIQPEKMRLQEKYVDEQSFWVDLKIIYLTIKTVILNKH